MKKISCAIVDDEPLGLEMLRRQVGHIEELTIAGEATGGFEAIAMVEETAPELLFLDIQMPEVSGFDVADALGAAGDPPVIVFVTAHDQYAIDAFERNAIDYVLKPVDSDRFRRAAEAAIRRVRTEQRALYAGRLERAVGFRRISVRVDGKIILLDPRAIDWAEAEGNYVRIHAGSADYLVRSTLQTFEEKVKGHPLVRIHRSMIVNLSRIASIQPSRTGDYTVAMIDGRELTLSRKYRDSFLELIGESEGAEN